MERPVVQRNKGRRKIEIARIANEKHRDVTFSKRRSGVFRKASELNTLTGADLAVVVFSPSNKVYSFGHPSVESIVDRYLNESNPPQTAPNPDNHSDLNKKLTETLSKVEAQKNRGAELDKRSKARRQENNNWWEGPVEELELEQLEVLKSAMEELMWKVKNEAAFSMHVNPNASANLSFNQSSTSVYGVGPNVTDDDPSLELSLTPHGYVPSYTSGNDANAAGPSTVPYQYKP